MSLRFAGKRRGFTVIEMIAVTVVIAVLASLLVGRLHNTREGIRFQQGVQSIESAANKAKSQAIQSGQTYELTFDNSTQSLKASVLDTTTTPTAAIPSTNAINTVKKDAPSSDSALGSGWSVSEVRLANGMTTTELNIKFYADGTAESKSVEFHSGNAPVTLIVKQNGSIVVKRGALTDQQPQEWEAGNIEQRNSG